MKDTITDLTTRRSCRKYTADPIAPDDLEAILRAGTYAPTGHGSQSPVMVLVTDPQTVELFSRINGEIMGAKHDPFYGAKTIVIVFADTAVHTGRQDAVLVMGNLMNAAHALGLGSCWINRAKEMFEQPQLQYYRAKWGLPDSMEGMGICILGHKAPGGTLSTPAPRKPSYIIRD